MYITISADREIGAPRVRAQGIC